MAQQVYATVNIMYLHARNRCCSLYLHVVTSEYDKCNFKISWETLCKLKRVRLVLLYILTCYIFVPFAFENCSISEMWRNRRFQFSKCSKIDALEIFKFFWHVYAHRAFFPSRSIPIHLNLPIPIHKVALLFYQCKHERLLWGVCVCVYMCGVFTSEFFMCGILHMKNLKIASVKLKIS